jgi:hypothetical protein
MSERTPKELLVLVDGDGKAWLPCNLDGEYSPSAMTRVRECATQWQSDRTRLATLEARVAAYRSQLADWDTRVGILQERLDALVPLALAGLPVPDGEEYPETSFQQDAAARAALAAIKAEQTTTTTTETTQ